MLPLTVFFVDYTKWRRRTQPFRRLSLTILMNTIINCRAKYAVYVSNSHRCNWRALLLCLQTPWKRGSRLVASGTQEICTTVARSYAMLHREITTTLSLQRWWTCFSPLLCITAVACGWASGAHRCATPYGTKGVCQCRRAAFRLPSTPLMLQCRCC